MYIVNCLITDMTGPTGPNFFFVPPYTLVTIVLEKGHSLCMSYLDKVSSLIRLKICWSILYVEVLNSHRSQPFYLIDFTSQKLLYYAVWFFILSHWIFIPFLTDILYRNFTGTITRIICFWSFVVNVYESFLSFFSSNLLISFHTTVIK